MHLFLARTGLFLSVLDSDALCSFSISFAIFSRRRRCCGGVCFCEIEQKWQPMWITTAPIPKKAKRDRGKKWLTKASRTNGLRTNDQHWSNWNSVFHCICLTCIFYRKRAVLSHSRPALEAIYWFSPIAKQPLPFFHSFKSIHGVYFIRIIRVHFSLGTSFCLMLFANFLLCTHSLFVRLVCGNEWDQMNGTRRRSVVLVAHEMW